MVVTGSQSIRNNHLDSETMSDSESDQGVPQVLSRAQIIEFEIGQTFDRSRDFDTSRIEQRFSDLNRQFSKITNIVLSL